MGRRLAMRNDPVLQPEDRRLVDDEVKFAEMIVDLAAGLVFARYPVEQIVDPREVIVEILDVRDLGNVALLRVPYRLVEFVLPLVRLDQFDQFEHHLVPLDHGLILLICERFKYSNLMIFSFF